MSPGSPSPDRHWHDRYWYCAGTLRIAGAIAFYPEPLMISFPCPHCDKPLRVKDELAGKKGKCPTCGKSITVPAVSENLAGALSEVGKRSPAPRSGSENARTIPPHGPADAPPPAD